jgi:hypothetical protein
MPSPNDDPTAYTTDIGSVWNPLEQRWVDASDVLFAHRYGMQVTRTPDRRWIFTSRSSVLAWQPHDRVFSRLSLLLHVPENNLDSAVPVSDGCAVMWNNTRELSYSYNSGAYVPVMYARNFTADRWTSGIDAPSAPVRASAMLTNGHTLLLAGASRDAIGGGAEWQQYRVSCDQVLALAPAGATPARTLYLPTRPPSAPKEEPVKAVVPAAPLQLSYLETWRATTMGLARSVREHVQGTLIFGGVVLLLLMRLANRWGVYHVEDDGRTPGRVIDLAVLGVSACALVAVIGAPWPLVRTLGMVIAASIIVFAAKRLWTNIETRRDKVLYGVPLGAGALLCALAIGSVIITRLYAIIDSLRDY